MISMIGDEYFVVAKVLDEGLCQTGREHDPTWRLVQLQLINDAEWFPQVKIDVAASIHLTV